MIIWRWSTWTWFSNWSGFLKAWSHWVQGNWGGPWYQLCLVSSLLWWNIIGHSAHCSVGSSCITAMCRFMLPIWENFLPQWGHGNSFTFTWILLSGNWKYVNDSPHLTHVLVCGVVSNITAGSWQNRKYHKSGSFLVFRLISFDQIEQLNWL